MVAYDRAARLGLSPETLMRKFVLELVRELKKLGFNGHVGIELPASRAEANFVRPIVDKLNEILATRKISPIDNDKIKYDLGNVDFVFFIDGDAKEQNPEFLLRITHQVELTDLDYCSFHVKE